MANVLVLQVMVGMTAFNLVRDIHNKYIHTYKDIEERLTGNSVRISRRW